MNRNSEIFSKKTYIFADEKSFDLISDRGLLSVVNDDVIGFIKDDSVYDYVPKKFEMSNVDAFQSKSPIKLRIKDFLDVDGSLKILLEYIATIDKKELLANYSFSYKMNKKDKFSYDYFSIIQKIHKLEENICLFERNFNVIGAILPMFEKKNHYGISHIFCMNNDDLEKFFEIFDYSLFKSAAESEISETEEEYFAILNKECEKFLNYLNINSKNYIEFYFRYLKFSSGTSPISVLNIKVVKAKEFFAFCKAIGFYDELMKHFNNFIYNK